MEKKKKAYKVGKIKVYVEAAPTLLNPDEAWETIDPLKDYTGTWTGTSFTKRLNLAIANFKKIAPTLSKQARKWAKFAEKAGAKELVIFKTETTEIGNAVIENDNRDINFSFDSHRKLVEITIRDQAFKIMGTMETTKNPRPIIASFIERIEAVKLSGVEFINEE